MFVLGKGVILRFASHRAVPIPGKRGRFMKDIELVVTGSHGQNVGKRYKLNPMKAANFKLSDTGRLLGFVWCLSPS